MISSSLIYCYNAGTLNSPGQVVVVINFLLVFFKQCLWQVCLSVISRLLVQILGLAL